MTRLERANRIAGCRCYATGNCLPPPDMLGFALLDWTCRYEYWNPPDRGHLIAASLALDGYPARWPHKRPAAPKEETPR